MRRRCVQREALVMTDIEEAEAPADRSWDISSDEVENAFTSGEEVRRRFRAKLTTHL